MLFLNDAANDIPMRKVFFVIIGIDKILTLAYK